MRNTASDPSAHHEVRSEISVVVSSDRTFGLVFASFFTIVGAWPLLYAAYPRVWAWATSSVFLFLALATPKLLHPLNLLWAKLAVVLHYIVSPLAMGLLFLLAFVPMGLFLRLLGKDILRLRKEPESNSYWLARHPPGPPPATMKEQF